MVMYLVVELVVVVDVIVIVELLVVVDVSVVVELVVVEVENSIVIQFSLSGLKRTDRFLEEASGDPADAPVQLLHPE